MGCLTPPSFRTKRMAHLAGPRQREASAKTGKVMRPYAVEGWQGAASASLTASCALRTAAEAAALCCLFLLRARAVSKIAILWALGCVTAPHAHTQPTHTHCTTCPGRIDWHSSHDCHRAQSTRTRREPRSSSEQHPARSRGCLVFRTFISLFVMWCCISIFLEFYFHFKTEMIVLGFCKQFQPDSVLVW